MTDQQLTPYPVDTLVDYHGSMTSRHGRYVITDHMKIPYCAPDPGTNYPDGVSYAIWPVGVEQSYRNRELSCVQVRRSSITPVT